jgi:gas vesicle protein
MADQLEGKWVVPNPQIPRAFGMMNLIFGILLFLMGAGYLAAYIIAPGFQKRMVVKMKEQQEIEKASRERKLVEIKAKETAAKAKEAAAKTKEETEKVKEELASIKEEREDLENDVEPDISAVSDLMGWNVMSDIRLTIYYFSEVISGMVLNMLMVISGVGLLGLAEWGRRLALGVAWLKILRWVAIMIVTMIVIVPVMAEKMDKLVQQVQVQAQAKSGAPPMPTPMFGFGQIMGILVAIVVVFSALVASIYPAISLWFLTRPPTRAACMQRPKAAEPPAQFDLGGLS